MPILFCPKCAAAMDRKASEIYCAPGEMGLSRVMEAALVARFAARLRASAPPPPPGAKWFCPACRVPMTDAMHCNDCGGTLADLQHQLVELHPHRDWPAKSTS